MYLEHVMRLDHIGDAAALIRSRAGFLNMKQKDIAEEMGVSSTSVRRWWTGESPPSREHCYELEQVLQLPSGDLAILYGYLPPGEVSLVERDGRLVVVSVTNPGYLNPEDSQMALFETAAAA